MKQSPAIRHTDGFGAAQDIQFSEKRVDMALHSSSAPRVKVALKFLALACLIVFVRDSWAIRNKPSSQSARITGSCPSK